MRRRSDKNVYAFIDSQNLNVSVQRLGWKMDWKKFRQFLTAKYNVKEAFMFIGYLPEQEKMYEQMHDAGYKVVLKMTYDMTKPRDTENGEGEKEQEERHIKGNIDADLVLWAMKEMKNYGKAVIVSGDGDFYSLVEYLEDEGKLLKLLAPSGHYSKLYNKYEGFVDRLDHYRNDLAYHDRKNRGTKSFSKRPAKKPPAS